MDRTNDDTASPRRAALVGWRLLALAYDLFPVAGLWFLDHEKESTART